MIQYCIRVKLWGDFRGRKVSAWALCFGSPCYSYFIKSIFKREKCVFLSTHLKMCMCISTMLVQRLLITDKLPS